MHCNTLVAFISAEFIENDNGHNLFWADDGNAHIAVGRRLSSDMGRSCACQGEGKKGLTSHLEVTIPCNVHPLLHSRAVYPILRILEGTC